MRIVAAYSQPLVRMSLLTVPLWSRNAVHKAAGIAIMSDRTMIICLARRPRNLAFFIKCAVRRRIMRPRYLFLVFRTFIRCRNSHPADPLACSIRPRDSVQRIHFARNFSLPCDYLLLNVVFSHQLGKFLVTPYTPPPTIL